MSEISRPVPCKTNPGRGSTAQIAFSNAQRTWAESADLVQLAAQAMRQRGYSIVVYDDWIEHPESGLSILPQVASIQPLQRGGVRTTSTVQVNHPKLIAGGVFEYQHSTGKDAADSFRKGFEQWAQTDFVALLEAGRTKLESCMCLQMELPPKDGAAPLVRRAVLGPVVHFMADPAARAAAAGETREPEQSQENHSFCPCCLLTNSFRAFEGMLKSDAFYALRLFAARDDQGIAQADCRVNGDDWEPGAAALREYVKKWPGTGYEFRKQYVVLHSLP